MRCRCSFGRDRFDGGGEVGGKPEGFQSTLDEIAPVEPRANSVKPQEMIDTRYLDEMEKSGFFEQIWAGKR